ncbi:MAG: hypothetical protein M3Y32_11180 [Pseudomonadota bacterium]|nr:hypothetical protein [Pseudomonadota bacterium]
MTEPTDPPVSEDAPAPPLPVAHARRSRWIGIVWAVPLAALLIVAFLGVRAFAERGIDVVVTFGTAAGARVNDTKVIYKGLEAGYVRNIAISDDGLHVKMTLRLDRRSKPWLTTKTSFWLIGANPNITDLASVKAAVAGLTIGVAPSLEGAPTRSFVGLDEPPLIAPGTAGTRYSLVADALGTARVGSSMFFRGQQIGKVITIAFVAPDRFQLGVFVEAPYDKLVHARSMFWISSPVQVELTDKGVSAALEHAGALINGAIELDNIVAEQGAAQSPSDTRYVLYQSRQEAQTGPTGPALPYRFVFKGAAGELAVGAQVRLLGFAVGEIRSVTLRLDPQSGESASEVQAVLYPRKLNLQVSDGSDATVWRTRTDAALNHLLARGFRARLAQSPPLIGGRLISLDRIAGAGKVQLTGDAQSPLIASDDTDTASSIDGLIGQVNQVLTKINGIPLQAIGQDVHQLTQRLSALVGSPAISDGLKHFDQTMAQADKLMADVTPRVGPLVDKLNRAAEELTSTVSAARGLLGGAEADGSGGSAVDVNLPRTIDQLSEAARAIRTLADYLGRHPEALLRGRGSVPAADAAKEPR